MNAGEGAGGSSPPASNGGTGCGCVPICWLLAILRWAGLISEETYERLCGKPHPTDGGDAPSGGCTVLSFNVPLHRTGCQQVAAAGVAQKGGEQFWMEADFAYAGTGKPWCCEYRQYVRGSATVNGRPVDHFLTNPAGGKPLLLLPRPPAGASTDNYQEDGYAGGNQRYGHRSDPDNTPGDEYLPLRQTGDRYRGSDFPSVTGPPGTTYSFDFDFRCRIIDVCNHDAVKQTVEFNVKCSGTL